MSFLWGPLLLLLVVWIASFSSRIVKKEKVYWGPQSCGTVLKLEAAAPQAVTVQLLPLVMMAE